MGLVSESDLTPADTPVDWMRDESRMLIELADGLDEFSALSRSPVHGDFYEGNVLETSKGEWFVIDWDDLAVGDPAADLTKLVGRNNSSLKKRVLERYSDRHLQRRVKFYERATLLDKVIDGLADYLVLSLEGNDALDLRTHKFEAYRDGLDEYRMRYSTS
jgi:aminoglycoside phosphotransferase (APT) family kinase protein